MNKKSWVSLFCVLVMATSWISPLSRADAPPTGGPKSINLRMVTERVSKENYNVYGNALRVYQSREAIQVARMNLLPKLNLWRLAGVVVDTIIGNYASSLGLVQDIAPFLIPANWFRVQEQRLLYMAEQEGYRALWANELMTAKALYLHLLLDRGLDELVKQSEDELRKILVIVQNRELLGGVPRGASRDIEVRLLALEEDHRALQVLIKQEEGSLSYLMAYPANVTLEPEPVAMPGFETLEPLDYEDFEFRAVSTSPEARQFDYFVAAADYVRKEVMYSFLGTTNMSRGVGGGVFDGLPIQDGLGFGTPASMRIVGAQKELLKTQKKGAEETLKRHLKLLVESYNLDLQNYQNLRRRVELTAEILAQLYERLRLGQDVDSIALIEASRNQIQAQTAFLGVQFRFLANEDRLARLIFHGDYNMKPVALDVLKK